MGFAEAVRHALTNYATFQGRARRSEYWLFVVFTWMIHVLAMILDITLLTLVTKGGVFIPPVFTGLSLLGFFIPTLAVTVRRLHDVGHPGSYIFFYLLPFVGWILQLVWMFTDSQPGTNAYGPNPKGQQGIVNPSGGDVSQQPPQPQRYLPAAHTIVCVSGPLQGQRFQVSQSGLLMGRNSSCNVVFPPMAPGVSSRHCRVVSQNGQLDLVDLSSTYGTFMSSGRRLAPNYPMPLTSGDRFWLGSEENCFEVL